MVKLSSNPTCVLSDADVITNEQAERIAKVLTKHLPGADNVTEAGKILGIDSNGDVALVEDKTGSTYTAGEGLTLENGEFSVDNPMPGASGATQGDVLTVGSNGPEWAAVPTELPDSTGASQGDVLTVGSSGPEWATPSGGGGGALYIDYGSVSLSTRADALALAEQIQGAIDDNKAVVLKFTDYLYHNSFYLPLTKFNLDPTVGAENGVIQFMGGANVVTEPTGTHLYSYLWEVIITPSSFTNSSISYFYGDVSAPSPIPTP